FPSWRCTEKLVTCHWALVTSSSLFPNIAHAVSEPARGNDFLLGVELDAFFPLNVEIAVERFVPTGEGKHGHGCGHSNVDPDHAGLDPILEFTSGFAGVRENGGAVSVSGFVRHRDRLIAIIRAHDLQ